MKIQYRIISRRHDLPAEESMHTVEGTDLADCDSKAQKHFIEKYVKAKRYNWDDLILLRIDVPAIPEKSTRLIFDDKHTRDERFPESVE